MTGVLEESEETLDQVVPGAEPAPSVVRSGWWGLAGGLFLFATLVVTNLDLLRTRIFEDGDFAANSILIDKAVTGPLLHGNYSRVGFYHPGPAILDAQALGQFVFHRVLGVVPSPFNGQFLGILALNALCVGIAVAIAVRRLHSPPAALALVPVVLMINSWIPYGLASTWMPHTYICPFLLLCVSGAAVATGSWHDLRYLALGAGITIDGHVSFVMFAGVTILVALVAGVVLSRRARAKAGTTNPILPRRDALWAGLVVALFALPLVADLVLHWPGQLEKYIKFTSNKTGFQPRSAGDIAHFVRLYWLPTGWRLLPVLAVAALAAGVAVRIGIGTATTRRFVLACLAVCALETVLVAVYGYRGVDDLSQVYVGYFAMCLPVIVLWLGLASVVEFVRARLRPAPARSVIAGAIVALALVPPVLGGTFANPYRGTAAMAKLSRAIGSHRVRLDFTTNGWPVALGLIEERRREGEPVCVVNKVWTVLATAPLICLAGASGELVDVLGTGDQRAPGGRKLIRSGTTELVEMPG